MDYGGLSKREIEMRKKMALRFGNQTTHLLPPKPEEIKVDIEHFLKKSTVKDQEESPIVTSDTGTSKYQKTQTQHPTNNLSLMKL
jgi:hypothetical protein